MNIQVESFDLQSTLLAQEPTNFQHSMNPKNTIIRHYY
jgi:hypothetical protein